MLLSRLRCRYRHVVFSCTASQVDRQLPVESIPTWRNRSAVDFIVLLDWRCSSVNLDPRGSVACLKDAIVKVQACIVVIVISLRSWS